MEMAPQKFSKTETFFQTRNLFSKFFKLKLIEDIAL